MKHIVLTLFFFITLYPAYCQTINKDLAWPVITKEAKPWTRWWWLGNAVDAQSLTYRMEEMSKAGIGGVEITPIYGTKGFENRFIDFLSPEWMQMLSYTINEGKRLNMGVDMNTGTGWPFGGPQITIADATSKYIIQTYQLSTGNKLSERIRSKDPQQKEVAVPEAIMAYSDKGEKIDLTTKLSDGILNWTAPEGNWNIYVLFNGKTFQKVKRAAPGGEGWVLDHFSAKATNAYLSRFKEAFKTGKSPIPNTFFNDSYEVYGADWTTTLANSFETLRGYRLTDYLPAFNGEGNADVIARVKCDYRETISDLLLNNFTRNWTNWAHKMGSITRNQAHGSPGNLIDLYGTVDIPECESFGTTSFLIPGLRIDTGDIKESDSDPMMQKFATSAAHITGKKYATSETFTWLSEHFRTALSQCKPELDQLFTSGVNHIFFHGTPYSPKDVPWPGWKFYASVDFSSYNTIWKDMDAFTGYIARCQSFLQYGEPDNEILIYWPVYDVWNNANGENYFAFQIESTSQWLKPTPFYHLAQELRTKGYDFDYISDHYIAESRVVNGEIQTPGNTYKTLIVPPCQYMPVATLQNIVKLIKAGGRVIFMNQFPQDVPGLGKLTQRRGELKQLIASLPVQSFTGNKAYSVGKGKLITGKNIDTLLTYCTLHQETLNANGLKYVRRKHADGYHYFIANLQASAVNQWITLGAPASSIVLFDPLTGESGITNIRKQNNKTEVYLQLKPGQSIIAKSYTQKVVAGAPFSNYDMNGKPQEIKGRWNLAFTEGNPVIKENYTMDTLDTWTALSDSLKSFAGTGTYSIDFKLPEGVMADEWLLDLGKVCESASITLNGHKVATLWSLPFETHVGKYLKKGLNHLEVQVTNLPANRIADYDRKKIQWRIFYEINFVNVFYKPFDASGWEPMPSGLIGPVQLIPLKKHFQTDNKISAGIPNSL